jgi:hypothetical protein
LNPVAPWNTVDHAAIVATSKRLDSATGSSEEIVWVAGTPNPHFQKFVMAAT